MLKNKTYDLRLTTYDYLMVFILFFLFCNLCFAQEPFKYDSKGRRNPFIPLVGSDGRLIKLETEEGSTAELAVEGIIYDKNGISYAIVNKTVVKVGDSTGDYQVLKIEKDRVLFIKEGQIKEIPMNKEEE